MEAENLNLTNVVEVSPKLPTIESILSQRGLERVPKIKIDFFFNSHATAEDGEAVGKRIPDSDILIQESAGWDATRAELYRNVAKGEITAEQAFEMEQKRGKPFFWKDFIIALFHELYGTKKEIALVDIPSESELFKKLIESYTAGGAYNSPIDKSLSFEEMLDKIGNLHEIDSDMQKAREDYILEHLPDALEEVLRKNPELQQKESLKVLFSMGAFHTRLFHELKKAGNDTGREFSHLPYKYVPRVALERGIHFKGTESMKSLLPKFLLYFIFKKELPGVDLTNEINGGFTDKQIEDIYEKYRFSSRDEFMEYLLGLIDEMSENQ